MRQRRAKSEQAVSLAMKSRWEEAAQLNREIVGQFPNEVDAYNRLGKALMELGRYAEARDAYQHAVKFDPGNAIAGKNLQRLAKLAEEGGSAPAAASVDPRLFIEESGKTTVTQLTGVRRNETTARLGAGDQLRLERRGRHQIVVLAPGGEEIGRIEPKLEQQLGKLLALGNEYSVFVTAANDHLVSVIVRETHRAPQMGTRPSFRPAAAVEGVRGYPREGALRFGADTDDDDEVDEDDEVDAGVAAPDADAAPEETPLEALAEAEDDDTEEEAS